MRRGPICECYAKPRSDDQAPVVVDPGGELVTPVLALLITSVTGDLLEIPQYQHNNTVCGDTICIHIHY